MKSQTFFRLSLVCQKKTETHSPFLQEQQHAKCDLISSDLCQSLYSPQESFHCIFSRTCLLRVSFFPMVDFFFFFTAKISAHLGQYQKVFCGILWVLTTDYLLSQDATCLAPASSTSRKTPNAQMS